jgi:DNA adenine methylase
VYRRYLPHFRGKYIEPFLGGASVFFHMVRVQERPFSARLGDTNRHLIRCYSEVRDHPEDVADRLEVLQAGYSAAKVKADFYYDVRETFVKTHPKSDAARFILLNRTCWNGLWRVNAHGRFNVPFGAPKTDVVVPSRNELVNVATALQSAYMRATSWEHTLTFAEEGDLVFLDPPYFSETLLGRDNYSDKYQRRVFGLREHTRVAQRLAELATRGVDFVLTNSAEREMVQLYEEHGLSVSTIEMPRAINSKVDQRRGARELVVTPGSRSSQRESYGAVLLDLDASARRARRHVTAAGKQSAVTETDL